MIVYNSFEEMPEISDGQVAHLKIDGEILSVSFKEQRRDWCEGCLFQCKPYGFCQGAKCVPETRSDFKHGIYVMADFAITEANWDFVDKNLTELGEACNNRQAALRVKMDEGNVLDRYELLEYYRNLAMVYIDAVNNFTQAISEGRIIVEE